MTKSHNNQNDDVLAKVIVSIDHSVEPIDDRIGFVSVSMATMCQCPQCCERDAVLIVAAVMGLAHAGGVEFTQILNQAQAMLASERPPNMLVH
jgi:uncharacterized protein (UPF0212 family)